MIPTPTWRCYTGTLFWRWLFDEPNIVVLLFELWNTILDIISDEGQGKKATIYNTPFSITASDSLWASFDSRYLYKDLEDRLKYGSVVVAWLLGKAKDSKEEERAPNIDPAINFER